MTTSRRHKKTLYDILSYKVRAHSDGSVARAAFVDMDIERIAQGVLNSFAGSSAGIFR